MENPKRTQTKDLLKGEESLSFQKYRNSIEFLQTHLHLSDASLKQTLIVMKNHPNQSEKIYLALNLNKGQYSKLNHPANQINAIVKKSQRKNVEFSIIRLYNAFTRYLQNITSEMFQMNPTLIIGKAVVGKNGDDKQNLNLTFAEIVRLGSYENIQRSIVSRIFRSMENLRSTIDLLERIVKDTKVNLSNDIKKNALKYLEMRHLYSHNSGLVDEKYATSYGSEFKPVLILGSILPNDIGTFNNALKAVTVVCKEIDSQLIKDGLIKSRS